MGWDDDTRRGLERDLFIYGQAWVTIAGDRIPAGSVVSVGIDVAMPGTVAVCASVSPVDERLAMYQQALGQERADG